MYFNTNGQRNCSLSIYFTASSCNPCHYNTPCFVCDLFPATTYKEVCSPTRLILTLNLRNSPTTCLLQILRSSLYVFHRSILRKSDSYANEAYAQYIATMDFHGIASKQPYHLCFHTLMVEFISRNFLIACSSL